ncbi:MAG: carboxylesterase family protein, partial [Solirubrobacteraceae bacterium]
RLGALGFLCREGVSEGNLRLLDQLAALRWVHEHIGAFGGDPEQVTLCGQSAGALSAVALMTAPEGRDLFARVILQSPPLGQPVLTQAQANAFAARLLSALGGASVTAASVESLLAAQGEVASEAASLADPTPPFGPVEQAPLLRRPLSSAALDGPDRIVPMLIGSTRDEMRAFMSPDAPVDRAAAVARMSRVHGARAAEAFDALAATRPNATPAAVLAKAVSDEIFGADSARFAEEHGGFLYRFDWCAPASGLGACHCIELPFVFGALAAWRDAQMLAGADPLELEALAGTVQRSWLRFVRTGDPGWPACTPGHRETMHFDAECRVVAETTT